MTESATSARPQARNAHSSSTTITNMMNRVLLLITFILRIILWPIARLSNILFPPKEFDGIANTADHAARAFASFFEKRYLPSHNDSRSDHSNPSETTNSNTDDPYSNPFQRIGYAKSLVEANRRNKLLFVYLHSPLHRKSDSFCTRILSHPRVLTHLTTSFITWGGSIHTADGANVARMLNVSAYPYVALLACSSTSTTSTQPPRIDLLWKMESDVRYMANHQLEDIPLEHFLAEIQVVLRSYENVIADMEMRRLRREEEVRLRQEQDREFQETLLADQQRENERIAKEKAEKEAKEAEENAIREAEIQKQNYIDECKSMLSPEPAKGANNSTRLRITLPRGTKIDRRFAKTDQIKHVKAFLSIWFHENDVKIEHFELSRNYPKKTFTDEEISLEDGGLCPMAVLMVQDLDA